MDSQKRISLVFGSIILLLIGLGTSSLFYLNAIAAEAESLYKHPYTVSNAARNINIHLVSMHRYMKDVALAENELQITTASDLVNQHEQIVLKNFDVIFDRYLGKRSDIQFVYNAFIEWKLIRDEVIDLKIRHENKAAADITKNKGAVHVKLLNTETQKLIDFADNKAKTFLNNAVAAKRHALTVVTIFMVITVIASIFISYYTVKYLNLAQLDVKSRMHLIDQNILMAKFDTDGVILDISSKLCRFLGLRKDESIGTRADFFIGDDEQKIRPEKILKIASTGETWQGEIRIINEDGIAQWIHSAVHPELDKNYTVRGYTNIIQDITDHKAVEELSITDTLTALHNRRYFDEVLEKELKIAHRNKTSITLAIIDIDFFKKYNDHYGHPVGDGALTKIAQVLKQSLRRPNDYAFRLGGEEFGLIFSDLNSEQTANFLELIRKRVASLQIEHVESDIDKYVTISIGAYLSNETDILNPDQLYIKADEALYQAKLQRNWVVVS